jgi:hypothetical protein
MLSSHDSITKLRPFYILVFYASIAKFQGFCPKWNNYSDSQRLNAALKPLTTTYNEVYTTNITIYPLCQVHKFWVQ